MDIKYLLIAGLVLQLCVAILAEAADTDEKEQKLCKCKPKKSKKRKSKKRQKREFTRLQFSDCGVDPDRPVRFLGADVTPMPVVVPGRMTASVNINVTRPIMGEIGLKVTLSRYLFGIPFSMPCMASGYSGFNVGSCVYETLCEKINTFVEQNEGCPRELADENIPCTCPINTGVYDMRHIKAKIPRLQGFLGYVVQGDYKIQAELIDWFNKTELGCLQMKWSIRKKSKRRENRRSSSWFGRRRRNAPDEGEDEDMDMRTLFDD